MSDSKEIESLLDNVKTIMGTLSGMSLKTNIATRIIFTENMINYTTNSEFIKNKNDTINQKYDLITPLYTKIVGTDNGVNDGIKNITMLNEDDKNKINKINEIININILDEIINPYLNIFIFRFNK